MPACERCWKDANQRAMLQGGSVVDRYEELLLERRNEPCAPREQAGQWWSESLQHDTRLTDFTAGHKSRGGE